MVRNYTKPIMEFEVNSNNVITTSSFVGESKDNFGLDKWGGEL